MQACSSYAARHRRTRTDLDSETQAIENCDQSVGGEPPEVRVPDAAEVHRRNAGSALGGPEGDAFPVKRLDDFSG